MAESHLTVDRVTLSGGTDGTVELPAAIFDAPINEAVMHQVVTAQLANARRDTAKTKTRGERAGGGAKPWRQKGTGRARHGSTRAPQWRRGGIAHGPDGRQNHAQRVNKKMKRAALRSALTDRARSGQVRVVGTLAFEQPKTRRAADLLSALRAGGNVLVVLADRDQAAEKSFRNIAGVQVAPVDQLNTYDVLCSDLVVFAEAALDLIGTGRRASDPAPASNTAPPNG
ncbi:MAG: 50S ribosomal protein L4 [Actinobacteria bacterium QS_8_72_14]|nr:MAG: 50S ribosomal protein L4 [Actinobacteria bacterium QS_8_72_14]